MRINCPCCGERSVDEFAYHGDATVRRPDAKAPDAMAQFTAAGCHAWLVVTRIIANHTIADVELARDVATHPVHDKREVA